MVKKKLSSIYGQRHQVDKTTRAIINTMGRKSFRIRMATHALCELF